jgi:serine protease
MLRVSRSGASGLVAAAAMAAALCSSTLDAVQQQAAPRVLRFRMGPIEAAARAEASRQRLHYVPNQVVVKFRDGAGRAGQQRALMALRSRPSVDAIRWIGAVGVLTDPSQPNPLILAEQLREQPEVEYAEPNYLYHPTARPNDPGYSRQWNFEVLDMPRAWDISPGGSKDVIVAIVDTGITTTNETLSFKTWNGSAIVDAPIPFAISPDLSPGRIVLPYDFSFLDSSTVLDMVGHGTHVGSTAAEDANNSLMEAGIAYNTRIMPVKVCYSYWEVQFTMSANGIPGFTSTSEEGGCADADIAAGIQYAADNGAKVINLSLGGPDEAIALKNAVQYAVNRGAFVAMSGGNEFEDGNAPDYPAKYGETIEGAMAVAAVGRSLRRAYYSNTGSYIEIAAPGGDERAGGSAAGIWQPTIALADSDPQLVTFPRFDRYAETAFQGTSMASPHVAGTAALIVSRLGDAATPAVVEQLLKKTARACDAGSCDPSAARVGALGRNDSVGVGLLQARAALFGFGLRR